MPWLRIVVSPILVARDRLCTGNRGIRWCGVPDRHLRQQRRQCVQSGNIEPRAGVHAHPRTHRPIKHPRRQFQRAVYYLAIITAAPGDVTTRLLDHLMDMDNAPRPRMPQIEDFPLLGPVGVLQPCSTIRAEGTRRSGTCHPSSSSANSRPRPLDPAHTSMPSCSRPSRSGLETPKQDAPSARRPSLTAARHDSRGNVQAGTKRCSRPNQKMASKRRTECPQPRYPHPKTSPLHQTGASPHARIPHLSRPL